MARATEIRVCKECKEEFIIRKNNKLRKYCDSCRNDTKLIYINQQKSRNKISKTIRGNFKLIGSAKVINTGGNFGVAYKRTDMIGNSIKTFTKEKVLESLESMKKDIQNNIDLIKTKDL